MVARQPRGRAANALAREVEERLDQTLRQVERVLGQTRPAAVALHRLHGDLRRLRVGVGVWVQVIPPKRAEELRRYERRLKRLARFVGDVRDRDVALGTLPSRPAPRERVPIGDLRHRLADDARLGREVLRMYLRTERDSGLFEGVRGTLRATPSARRHAEVLAHLRTIRNERSAAVRDAHREARRRPSMRRLHRLRIRVRTLRHVTDLAQAVEPAPIRRPPPRLRVLQRRLGKLHDLEVLRELAAPVRDTRWANAIEQERRRQRRLLLRTLRTTRPREIVPAPEAST